MGTMVVTPRVFTRSKIKTTRHLEFSKKFTDPYPLWYKPRMLDELMRSMPSSLREIPVFVEQTYEGPGFAETYPAAESRSPNYRRPGENYINIRPGLPLDQLRDTLEAEVSSHLMNPPQMAQFAASLTPRQMAHARRSYEYTNDPRTFEQYFQTTWLPSMMRAFVYDNLPTPEGEPPIGDFRKGFFTPQQLAPGSPLSRLKEELGR